MTCKEVPSLQHDGRNPPDTKRFIELAKTEGAVTERDRLFGDHSQAPDDEKPNLNNVIYS